MLTFLPLVSLKLREQLREGLVAALRVRHVYM